MLALKTFSPQAPLIKKEENQIKNAIHEMFLSKSIGTVNNCSSIQAVGGRERQTNAQCVTVRKFQCAHVSVHNTDSVGQIYDRLEISKHKNIR